MAKLVEILARQLKEWPDCKHGEKIETKALTQDDDGRINTLDSDCFGEQDQFSNGVWSGAVWTWTDLNFERAEDYATAIVTRAEWQAAVDALNKPDEVEWDGVGLPPVGTEFEFNHPGLGKDGWVRAKVYAYPDGTHMLGVTDDPRWGNQSNKACRIRLSDDFRVRPIRTPEQVAADERLHRLHNAHTAIARTLEAFRGDIPAESVSRQVIEAMIDAGYRKQEPK